MNSLLNGLVLCGGKSSRMGKDKSLIPYHGKPQRDHLVDLLRLYCTQVYLSMPRGTKISQTCIPDHFEIESPLNGILSAFHFDPEAAWLSVPIDMPNIDQKTIEFLLKKRNPNKDATCFLNSDREEPEPLLTIWEPRSRPVLFDFFNHGEVSPKSFLMDHDVQFIKAPTPSWLVNLNTEEELQQYLKKSGKTLQGI